MIPLSPTYPAMTNSYGFVSMSVQSQQHHGHLGQSRETEMWQRLGFNTKKIEEARCFDSVCNVISMALFKEEEEIPEDSDWLFKINTKIKHQTTPISSSPLSEHKIAPGANIPSLIVTISQIQGIEFRNPLRALIDSGSKYSFLYRSASPLDAQTSTIPGITTNSGPNSSRMSHQCMSLSSVFKLL